jgi:hypothetical protein
MIPDGQRNNTLPIDTILETYDVHEQYWQLFRVLYSSSAAMFCTIWKDGRVVQHNPGRHNYTVWNTNVPDLFQIGSKEARIVSDERMFEFQLMQLSAIGAK